MSDADEDRATGWVEAVAEDELAAVAPYLWAGETPVPVVRIADSHYGLLVRERPDLTALADTGVHVSGLLEPARREIWVNAWESGEWPARRRFTVAHELGHWVLHCDRGRAPAAAAGIPFCRLASAGAADVAADPDATPLTEQEAHRFAAATLMPRVAFAAAHAAAAGDLVALRARFEVSEKACARRIATLGLG